MGIFAYRACGEQVIVVKTGLGTPLRIAFSSVGGSSQDVHRRQNYSDEELQDWR